MQEPVPKILSYVFLVSTMPAIGLTVAGAEILGAAPDRRLMGRALPIVLDDQAMENWL
jgi:hypothetical protein